MTEKERYIAVNLFKKADKMPFRPGNGRESTLARWQREGLTIGADPIQKAYEISGGKEILPSSKRLPAKFTMIPEFEKKIIERRTDSQIVQDWKGNICEIGNEYSVDYLGGENSRFDFVTRRWIKCPVESRQEWDAMKKRYDADDPARFEAVETLRKDSFGTEPLILSLYGPFWQLREWTGFENLCVLFYDDPGLLEDMLNFWKDYILKIMKKAFSYAIPDEVHISEDMAYKHASMISPEMCRKYLLPVWAEWGECLKNAGVPIYACDSDGYIDDLIPLWIEAGINACDPVEVAANNDIVELRKKYGKKMAFRGGVDKREMAKGGRNIENEIKRIRPVIQNGGYIPGCDHGVPHDISWENFVYYIKLIAKETGWL